MLIYGTYILVSAVLLIALGDFLLMVREITLNLRMAAKDEIYAQSNYTTIPLISKLLLWLGLIFLPIPSED